MTALTTSLTSTALTTTPASPAASQASGAVALLRSGRQVPALLAARVQSRLAAGAPDAGMTTAEYAVGTVAACGFGGVLYKVITSDSVLELITSVISKAFHLSF